MRPLAWLDRLDAIAPTLVEAAVRGAVVLLIALVVSHLLRRRSAAARHLVWVGAIAVQLALPLFAIWGPRWNVAVPASVANVLVGVEVGTRYQRNQDNTQWLANVGVIGSDTTHYLFGYLSQDLLSFTGRVDVTLRPTVSLQLYVEPFVTAGRFTNVRELADPRAADYDARYRPYAGRAPDGDFNEKSFNTSAVARWEYRPGSTLFVVWTQGRFQDDRDIGSFAARRDYANLFAARPDNVFLVKASYWIGR